MGEIPDIYKSILIEDLSIETKAKNVLEKRGIYTIANLLEYRSKKSLHGITGLGSKAINQIKLFLMNEIQMSIKKINDSLKNEFKDEAMNQSNHESKNIPIEVLNLSVRSANALKNYGIDFTNQLEKLTEKDMALIPNLGKKSKNEILSNQNIHIKIKRDLRFDNIADALDFLFEKKFFKNKEFLEKRLFHNFTLEQCGELAGVTRERIRQIESKFIRSLKSCITNKHIEELSNFFEDNKGINNFFELNNIGSSYNNISKYLIPASNPKNFLNHFFVKDNLLKWQKKKNFYYLYSSNSNSLDELIHDDELINFITNSASANLHDSVKAYCLIKNQESNFSYIFEEIKNKLTKRIKFACLYAVIQLKKDFTYINLKQVIEFLKINCGKDFSDQKRTINNILSSSDVRNPIYNVRDLNLYITTGSGNFFFLDKLEIDSHDKEQIISYVIDILEKSPDKNFSSVEFDKHFKEQKSISPNTLAKLDKYIIDAILLNASSEHNVLNYLGRNSWSGDTNSIHVKRKEIYPTVLKILEKNGAPMRVSEIELELSKIRGLGKAFQPHTTLTTPNIVVVSQGLWGLRDRDINVSKDEELELVTLIKKEFKNGNKILNFKDLKAFKGDIGIDNNVSVFQLMRILLAHIPVGRRRSPSNLIFLHKLSRKPLNFCFHSPDVSDEDAKEFLINNSENEFLDVRNNEDSITPKREFFKRKPSKRKLFQEYDIEGKLYLGRASVAKEYGISTDVVYYRTNSDKYPHWKALKDLSQKKS
jgi:hypothetical protein